VNTPLASPADHGGTCDHGLLFLDEVQNLFASHSATFAMGRLGSGLHQLKRRLNSLEWTMFKMAWRHHPIARIVHQDPFTSWSYRKVRGYPGDARLLDFIYGAASVADDVARASVVGREIHAFSTQTAAPAAVRERRDIVASLVDQIADHRRQAISVLSIAGGHLREAEKSRALAEAKIERWVALDQDAKSIAHIRKQFNATAIEPFGGSIPGLLSDQYRLGSFDLVYAAGLYDYLAPGIAARLTELMFSMLKPGGTLLFANFAKDIPDDGYMETFMDWQLRFRGETELEEFWSRLPDCDVAGRQTFRGANGNVIYAKVSKN
jgi:SAM-dependent methyltransferase